MFLKKQREMMNNTTDKSEIELTKLIDIRCSNLKNSEQCLSYLKQRGLNSEDIQRYKIGYFPQNLSKLIQHIPSSVLQKLSIMNYSEKSLFSDFFYLVFPIISEYGDSIGVAGRTLLDQGDRDIYDIPKYLNSSFKKANILYGLNLSQEHIIKENNVYIVEGYFDYIALDKNGINNTVAICGTAFSKNHFLKLARYADKFTFILDGDESGLRSMEKIYAKFINKGIKLRFMLLPKGFKDVDEYFASGRNANSFKTDLEDFIPNY
jgi:DNA primase